MTRPFILEKIEIENRPSARRSVKWDTYYLPRYLSCSEIPRDRELHVLIREGQAEGIKPNL